MGGSLQLFSRETHSRSTVWLMDNQMVIRTSGLTKRFGRTLALNGLELAVGSGEVHGFLGPNGAGKSTTIRILLGLVRATSGDARVFGLDPWTHAQEVRSRLAAVPGDVAIWPNLSGGETIDLLSRLRGASHRDPAYLAERDRLCQAFQLDPRVKGRAYSKGNRQKVALVAALAVPAALYVFDEPTSGLDPLMEVIFRNEVDRLRERGAAILLSSHILSEVEQLCDRVSIIRAGQIVDSGSLTELRHLSHTEVSFQLPGGASTHTLPDIPGAENLEVENEWVHFTVPTHEVTALLPRLATMQVEGLRIEPPTLETLFLHHYGDAPVQA